MFPCTSSVEIDARIALKQFLTSGCTKWEISALWNIGNPPEHVLSLSVQAHPGLPFHLQLPWKKGISSSQVSLTRAAPRLPDTCSSCPDPCTAAQRGCKGPVQLQQVWLQQHGDARALVMLNYVTSQEEGRITSCWVLWRCVQQQYWKSHGSKLSLLQLNQLEENKVLNCINEYSVTRTKKLVIC